MNEHQRQWFMFVEDRGAVIEALIRGSATAFSQQLVAFWMGLPAFC